MLLIDVRWHSADRQSRRCPSIATRAIAVPQWHKKIPNRMITCNYCYTKHDDDHQGCIAWFDHPDHPGADAGQLNSSSREDNDGEGEEEDAEEGVQTFLGGEEDSDSELSDCPM